MKLIVPFFIIVVVLTTTLALPSTSFTQRESIINFVRDHSTDKIKDAYFATEALRGLNAEPHNKKEFCDLASETLATTTKIDLIFFAVHVAENLGCGKTVAPGIKSAIFDTTKSSQTTVRDLYYATSAAFILRAHDHIHFEVEDIANTLTTLDKLVTVTGTVKNSAKESRGTLYASGLAYQIASYYADVDLDDEYNNILASLRESAEGVLDFYTDNDAGRCYIDLPDVRSALRVTSTLISGVVALADSPIEAPFDGVAEYVLSKQSPGSLMEAYYFVNLLNALTSKKISVPVVLNVIQNTIYAGTKSDGSIKVRITDLVGNAIPDIKVYVLKATPFHEETHVLVSNQLLPAVSDGPTTDYEYNFAVAKPDKGFYAFEFGVQVGKQALQSTSRTIKVLSSISVDSVQLNVIDSSDKEVVQRLSANQNTRFGAFQTSYFYQLDFSFVVKNKLTNKPSAIQQAFVRFSGNGIEATFAAQFLNDKYALSLNMREAGSKLLYRSGDYKVELIIGDAFIDNSFVWELGTSQLSFPPSSQLPIVENVYVAKPEITHKFRDPESRPSLTTSFAFTCLVLSPCAVLVLGLLAVGFNIKFPGGLGFIYSVLFLGFVVAIFGLYVVFWLQLNMFQTLQYLLPLAVGATITGNLALRARAAKPVKPKQA